MALMTASEVECTACNSRRNPVSQVTKDLIDASDEAPGLFNEGMCMFNGSICSLIKSGSLPLSQISSISSVIGTVDEELRKSLKYTYMDIHVFD